MVKWCNLCQVSRVASARAKRPSGFAALLSSPTPPPPLPRSLCCSVFQPSPQPQEPCAWGHDSAGTRRSGSCPGSSTWRKVCLCDLDSHLSVPSLSVPVPSLSVPSVKIGPVTVPSSRGCWSVEGDVQQRPGRGSRSVLSMDTYWLESTLQAQACPWPTGALCLLLPNQRVQELPGYQGRQDPNPSRQRREREGRLGQVSKPAWPLPGRLTWIPPKPLSPWGWGSAASLGSV